VVNLTWSPGAGGTPTSFNLYRGAASGQESATPIATVDGTTYSYQDTGLSNGTTYYYNLTATNGIGTGPISNEVSAVPAQPAIALGPGNSGNTSATVTSGGAAAFNLTLTSTNYAGTVTYSCTGAPAGDTCSVAPSTVGLTPATTSSAVVVTVQTTTSAMIEKRSRYLLGIFPWVGALFAVQPWRTRKRLGGLATLLFATAALVALSACGGGSSNPAPTTSTLTVTATGTGSVTPATATLTLTVE
jgi:hypothetical protein